MLVMNDKIHLKGVGVIEGATEFFRLFADLMIIHRKPALQNNVIQSVQGGTAKAILLGKGGQWGGGRIGGNT